VRVAGGGSGSNVSVGGRGVGSTVGVAGGGSGSSVSVGGRGVGSTTVISTVGSEGGVSTTGAHGRLQAREARKRATNTKKYERGFIFTPTNGSIKSVVVKPLLTID